MIRERTDPLVEILTELADTVGVLSQRELTPAIGDDLEQADEVRGRRDQDLLRHRVFLQGGILIQRGGQELISRDEQDHEFGTMLKLRPVRFARQGANVLAYPARVPAQRGLALVVAGGLHGFEIGVQRRLDIHDQLAFLGHAHHHVRPDCPVGRLSW